MSERETFDFLNEWVAEAAKFGMTRELPVVVCANKVDKVRRVTEEEGRAWATGKGYVYFESSAQSGANIHELFDSLFKAALEKVIGRITA